MMGIKALLALRQIDESYFFKENDVFRYDLWFEGAEYSVFLQKFNNELIEISLLHFQKDMWVNRHLYLPFNDFIELFDNIEFDVFLNRKIPFFKKPIEIWKALETKAKGGLNDVA